MRQRKRNRIKGFDYSRSGAYFVTICTHNRCQCFGSVENENVILNKYGKIADEQWNWLSIQYPYVILDEYVVMPDHFHGILCIMPPNHVDNNEICIDVLGTNGDVGTGRVVGTGWVVVGTGRDLSLRDNRKIKSLSELTGAFKTRSSKYIHNAGLRDFAWQRSFYDRIIRTEKEMNNIREYIRYNPKKWESGK